MPWEALWRIGGGTRRPPFPRFDPDNRSAAGFLLWILAVRIGFASPLPVTLLAVPGLPLGGRYPHDVFGPRYHVRLPPFQEASS
jgi:hypothetical protein